MKTEQEIKDIFDGFERTVKDNMLRRAGSFHMHSGNVGWSKATPKDIKLLKDELREYDVLMAMLHTSETLRKSIFGEERDTNDK